MSVSKPSEDSIIESIIFRLVDKGFILHFEDGQALVCPWSNVESFYFFKLKARFILKNGKSYSYDFKDGLNSFKKAYQAYLAHSND